MRQVPWPQQGHGTFHTNSNGPVLQYRKTGPFMFLAACSLGKLHDSSGYTRNRYVAAHRGLIGYRPISGAPQINYVILQKSIIVAGAHV